MFSKHISSLLLVVFLLAAAASSGCAAWPEEQYERMNLVPADRIAQDRMSMLRMTKPAGLPWGEPVNSSIDEDDPMASLEISGKSIRTHYELYAFDGKKDRSFTIALFSYCDCLGFRKFLMLPHVEVFDRHGTVVSGPPRSMRDAPPGLVDAYHVIGTWGGKIPEDGIYFVLVAADNRCIGGSAGTVKGHGSAGTLPVGMTLKAHHHPFGAYTLKFNMR